MTAPSHHNSVGKKTIAGESGQATVELATAVPLVLIMLFAIIDFGRALNYVQVMIELTRQGSNLASRGDTLSQAASAVVSGDTSLNLNSRGEVIVTSVSDVNNVYTITGQVSQGGTSQSSKIGNGVGTRATVPAVAAGILQPGQTLYVTEVFYSYQAITPIANFVRLVVPSTLYEVAYF